MSVWSSISAAVKSTLWRTPPHATPQTIEAQYDAAQTTPDNRRHWRFADGLSAKAANNHWVRKTIRDRARYEAANNPIVQGIVNTLANDVVGFGATLQINSPDEAFNAAVKLWWERWCKATRLWSKLRLARKAKAVDGEVFLLLVYDPTVKHPVKWNVAVIECDRIHTPDQPWDDPRRTDGIVYDEFGNPVEYHLLRSHPGDQGYHVDAWRYDQIPAAYMLHWFTATRAGQLRGVSELAPSLGTWGDLRRFGKAVLKKRECEASIHGFIKQQVSPDLHGPPGDKGGMTPWMEFDVEMGTWMALPDGSDPVAFESSQTADPYSGYKREAISDGARPWGMSYNVAACNSGDSSFSAGKLDHRLYGHNLELEQDEGDTQVITPLFRFWMEAARHGTFSIIPDDSLFDWEETFDWKTLEDPDPSKTADADAADIDAGIVSRTTVQMRRKLDPALEESRLAAENGMTVAELRAARKRQFTGPPPAPLAATPGPPSPPADGLPPRQANGAAHRGREIRIGNSSARIIEAKGAKWFVMRPAYSGGLLDLPDWEVPVVVDLRGLDCSRQQRPILLDHKKNRDGIAGYSRTIVNDLRRIVIAGKLLPDTDAGKTVDERAADGYPWEASIGVLIHASHSVPAGETVTVNGQTFTGPLEVVDRGRLRETSFCVIGADGRAAVEIEPVLAA